MSNIETTVLRLEVARVENGWMVNTSNYVRGDMGGYFVAKTPAQLAELIINWAQAQADEPAK